MLNSGEQLILEMRSFGPPCLNRDGRIRSKPAIAFCLYGNMGCAGKGLNSPEPGCNCINNGLRLRDNNNNNNI